jgi:uncharacterized protein YjiS (DUF1127 family)
VAFYTDTIDSSPKTSLASRIWHGIGRFLLKLSHAQDRTPTVNRMQRLSDDELAKMGLRREDIVSHVYRDHFCV